MKFTCVKKILNLRTISFPNIPYFLRQVIMNKIRDTDNSLIDQNGNSLFYTLHFDKENINDSENAHILMKQ